VKKLAEVITPLRIVAGFYIAMILVVSKRPTDFTAFWSMFFKIVLFAFVVLGCDFLLMYLKNKWLYWLMQLLLAALAFWISLKLGLLWDGR